MNILGNNSPAGGDRIEISELTKQVQSFSHFPMLIKFLDALPVAVLVLNKHRQAVYSNRALFELTGRQDPDFIFGMRPGEILDCTHANEHTGGCGMTEFCTTCGALNAILSSHNNNPDVQECRIIKKNNEALDLRIHASPFTLGDEKYTIFSLTDISDEKRRLNLERIFFHDLLNTASTVKALAYNLEGAEGKDSEEFRSHLVKLSDKLVDEICAQRDIYAAENNELAVYLTRISASQLLNDIREQFSFNTEDIIIVVDKDSDRSEFYTDKILIRRILSNMIKNAVEASPKGGVVTIGASRREEAIEIRVHNEGLIPKNVQLQIFQRSFSTKGFGRGIGTYSMKLLCEKYLKGNVSFRSTEAEGTTFYCQIPLNLD